MSSLVPGSDTQSRAGEMLSVAFYIEGRDVSRATVLRYDVASGNHAVVRAVPTRSGVRLPHVSATGLRAVL